MPYGFAKSFFMGIRISKRGYALRDNRARATAFGLGKSALRSNRAIVTAFGLEQSALRSNRAIVTEQLTTK